MYLDILYFIRKMIIVKLYLFLMFSWLLIVIIQKKKKNYSRYLWQPIINMIYHVHYCYLK